MREIKYQAWHRGHKKIYQMLSLSFDSRLDQVKLVADNPGGYILANMRQLDLREYTGLQDKNGKEIYESDRIKQFGNPEPFVVEFRESAWRLGQWILGVDIKIEALEVIGNIYENKEALDEQER